MLYGCVNVSFNHTDAYCHSDFLFATQEKIVENCRITGQSRPKEGSGEEGVSFEKEVSVRVSRVADMPPDDPRILAQLNTQLNRYGQFDALKMWIFFITGVFHVSAFAR